MTAAQRARARSAAGDGVEEHGMVQPDDRAVGEEGQTDERPRCYGAKWISI